MSHRYGRQTRVILEDFLDVLSRNKKVDPHFIAELRTMIRSGHLDNPSRIRQAVAKLEERANDLQN